MDAGGRVTHGTVTEGWRKGSRAMCRDAAALDLLSSAALVTSVYIANPGLERRRTGMCKSRSARERVLTAGSAVSPRAAQAATGSCPHSAFAHPCAAEQLPGGTNAAGAGIAKEPPRVRHSGVKNQKQKICRALNNAPRSYCYILCVVCRLCRLPLAFEM